MHNRGHSASTLLEFSLLPNVEPTAGNGLKAVSQVMVDKVLAYPRAKCGPVIGRLSPQDMLALNNMLLVMFGLAD